jgi:chorismate mutase
MSLPEWRAQIDQIDRQLQKLLGRRARLSLKIGAYKQSRGLPVVDVRREKAILGRVARSNKSPLPKKSVLRIFTAILQESRTLQRGKKG